MPTIKTDFRWDAFYSSVLTFFFVHDSPSNLLATPALFVLQNFYTCSDTSKRLPFFIGISACKPKNKVLEYLQVVLQVFKVIWFHLILRIFFLSDLYLF